MPCKETKPAKKAVMTNGRCRMHGGTNLGAPKGNRNNFQHGRYSAEAIAGRHKIRELVRAMRALARKSKAGEARRGSGRQAANEPR